MRYGAFVNTSRPRRAPHPFSVRMKPLALTLTLLLFLAACGKPDTPATDTAGGDIPVQLFPAGGNMAGSHILIAYQGAQRARPEITRTKEEALEKARKLIAELKEDPGRFEELARQESDGPTGARGGNLGTWNKGQMVPEFDNALEQLDVGAITDEPVETAFGYHIIRRNTTEVPVYGADGFFIAYQGAPAAPDSVTRDRAAAEALAADIQARLTADNFDALAHEYNDMGEGAQFLGVFKEGDQVPPELLDALKGLHYEEPAGPLDFPAYGFAFVRRKKVDRRAAAHILVAYQGAERADPSITRTKEEALEKARTLIAELQQDPSRFSDLAREESDGPSGANGGDLGVWFKGQMVPEFDAALDDLDVGQITSEPVETAFGFHIIQRRVVPE